MTRSIARFQDPAQDKSNLSNSSPPCLSIAKTLSPDQPSTIYRLKQRYVDIKFIAMGCNQSETESSLPALPDPQPSQRPGNPEQAQQQTATQKQPCGQGHPATLRTDSGAAKQGSAEMDMGGASIEGAWKGSPRLQEELQKFIDELFDKYDANGNGKLNIVEFGKLLKENADERMSPEEIKEFLKLADGDSSKSVDKKELLTLYRTLIKY